MSEAKKLTPEVMRRITEVAADVIVERARQHAKWGEQNHPNLVPSSKYELLSGDLLKATCGDRFARGEGAWVDILLEELGEALDEARMAWAHDPTTDDHELALARLRDEMVQVAAVACAWVEAVDRQLSVAVEARHRRMELER